jgi:hypothetical protein
MNGIFDMPEKETNCRGDETEGSDGFSPMISFAVHCDIVAGSQPRHDAPQC